MNNHNQEEDLTQLKEKFNTLEEMVSKLRDVLLSAHRHTVDSFGKVDENFEVINAKIDKLIASSEDGFEDVGGKIDKLQTEIKKIQKVSNYPEEYENLLRISG